MASRLTKSRWHYRFTPGSTRFVVIGGLITSTLLTCLVLPAIYHWFVPRQSA